MIEVGDLRQWVDPGRPNEGLKFLIRGIAPSIFRDDPDPEQRVADVIFENGKVDYYYIGTLNSWSRPL